MCIIIFSPNGVIPARHLRESLTANPHGWGFVTPDSRGDLYLAKGLSRRRFWREWRDRPQGNPTLFHSRICTHGKVDYDNAHPWRLRNHPGVAFMHNGIIKACAPAADCPESDTRLFARKILEALPENFLLEPAILDLLGHYVGHSKLAFIDARGDVTLVNEHLGHWFRERWYSNRSYLPTPPVKIQPAPNRGPAECEAAPTSPWVPPAQLPQHYANETPARAKWMDDLFKNGGRFGA